MSTDQTIIAWKHENNDSVDILEEPDKIRYQTLESEEPDEVADDLPKTETQTGSLTNSRNVSIGSFEGSGEPGGVEEDRKTVGRLKKTSLCSTLSSGDQPYLSLISSERDQAGG